MIIGYTKEKLDIYIEDLLIVDSRIIIMYTITT